MKARGKYKIQLSGKEMDRPLQPVDPAAKVDSMKHILAECNPLIARALEIQDKVKRRSRFHF